MPRCSQCGTPGTDGQKPAATICGGIMGDEYAESYYHCERCGAYTVVIVHDRFLGEEESSVRGPLTRAEGEKMIRIIQRCSVPWDKTCRCEAHREYFGDCLD